MNKSNKKLVFTESIERMDQLLSTVEQISESSDIMDAEMDSDISDERTVATGGDEELLDRLNQIFTPILVMQGFEDDISDKIQEALSEASVLMEKNIIQFDNASKMAQLISVCALLIEQQKKTNEWEMFVKASKIRKATKINIQKKNYESAKVLAQKFLVKVSTSNGSSIARQAANDLLPETQH